MKTRAERATETQLQETAVVSEHQGSKLLPALCNRTAKFLYSVNNATIIQGLRIGQYPDHEHSVCSGFHWGYIRRAIQDESQHFLR
jgi:hypothetical protein